MFENKKTYMGENKTILKFVGTLFQNVAVQVANTVVAADSNGIKRLKAGTLLSKDGKIVDGTTVTNDKAYGLVYADVDFTHSNGTEMVPVTVFGFIDSSALPSPIPDAAKTAMKMLMFL